MAGTSFLGISTYESLPGDGGGRKFCRRLAVRLVKSGYEQFKVFYEDILYLEASGNYVTFVLKDKKILSRSTFIEATNLLPKDKFVRLHRSYIIPVDKV